MLHATRLKKCKMSKEVTKNRQRRRKTKKKNQLSAQVFMVFYYSFPI